MRSRREVITGALRHSEKLKKFIHLIKYVATTLQEIIWANRLLRPRRLRVGKDEHAVTISLVQVR